MTPLEWLIHTDKSLFIAIQRHLAGPFLDPAMLLFRNPLTWIPLYAFLLYWIVRKDRAMLIPFVLFSAATVGFTDFTAAHFLKPWFGRTRPCYDPEVLPYLRGLINCGGVLSFPSNHATNHFGLAAFWFWAIRYRTGRRWYWLWFWAALICFAQVYVGKHFPLDVTAGALYGIGAGAISFAGYKWVSARWTWWPGSGKGGPGSIHERSPR